MFKSDSAFYKAAKEILIEYFQKTSLNGFGLLYYIRRRKYQRIFWFMFIFLGISFAIYVVVFTLLYFLQDPTVTTLETQHYDIRNIPFPAVAVCSVNKLSRSAVEAYVERVAEFNQSEYWRGKLKLLAGFFDSEAVDFEAAAEFHKELVYINGGGFSLTNFLKELAPTCDDLLVKCRWAGHLKPCNELFQLHAIASGYCCMFNYKHLTSANNTRDKISYYPTGTGTKMGLTMLLNTSTSDYYFTERSSSAYTLQIFGIGDFPDDSSGGGLQELFVPVGVDVDVQLSVTTQTTTKDVRTFNAQKRRCYFTDENVQTYGLDYTQGECLMRCKALSMLQRCDCIPYYMPKDFLEINASAVSHCTLAQLECLERYSVIWNTYRTDADDNADDRIVEQQDSLACADCLPLCSYNYYSYRKDVSLLRNTQHLSDNKQFLDRSVLTNASDDYSLVKLYFTSPYAVQYRKNVLYNWYQILSNIGGVIGISMGCSLISGFELIYFFGFRLFEKVQQYRRATNSD